MKQKFGLAYCCGAEYYYDRNSLQICQFSTLYCVFSQRT